MGNAGLNLESLCDGENSMHLMHGIDIKMMNHHGCLAFNFVRNLVGIGQIKLGVGLQIVINDQIKYVFY